MSISIPGTGAMTLPSGSALVAEPAQFDASLQIASTAFVREALGNLPGDPLLYNANTTLTASQAGNLILIGGAYQMTLPTLAATVNGSAFTFLFTGAGGSIKGAGSELIQSVTGANVYSAYIGEKITIVKRNNAWYASSGGFGTDGFLSSIGANGYQKLPSGLIIQWGVFVSSASADTSVTFPIAFPSACRSVTLGPIAGTPAAYIATLTGSGGTTTGFVAGCWTTTPTRAGTSVYWMAIGN
jgi:hypothetical protein